MEARSAEYPAGLVRAIRFLATLAGFAIFLLFIAIWVGLALGGTGENAFPIDFAAFWGAAQLALDGRAEAAFSDAAMRETLNFPGGTQLLLPWLYPPTWAMIVTPFGLLPFWAAWIAFAAVSLAVYLAALRPWSVRMPGGLGLVLASPVVLIGIFNSNNGLITAGLASAALWQMHRDRAVAAGLLIGILSAKPTLGLLLPIAFAAGGRWRSFFWSALFTVGFAGVAALVFGLTYWEVFYENLVGAAGRLEGGSGILLDYKITWYGSMRAFGAGHSLALLIQLVVSLIVAGAIAWFWASRAAFPAKAAALLVAIMLATPYGHYYELALPLAGAVVWTYAGGARRPDEIALIAVIWLLPVIVPLTDFALLPLLAAPVVSTFFLVILLRAHRCKLS